MYRYIRGGCGTLVKAALDAFAAAGGTVRTSATVTRITTDGGRATGVVVNGKTEPADVVVATAGARETFYQLLGAEHLTGGYRAKIDGQVQMESVFMVHLGLDREPVQPSALCYYYGSYDVEKAVDDIRAGRYHDGADGFVLYIPSRHSPGMAPPGSHALTIYTVAPNVIPGADWDERKELYADHLVGCAEKHVPGLAAATRTRLIVTPADFRRRVRQEHHSFGGIAPVRDRPNPTYRTPVPNLWFIGSQSESSGGVLGVMKGAADHEHHIGAAGVVLVEAQRRVGLQRVRQDAFAELGDLHAVLDDDGVLADQIDAADMAVEIDAHARPVEPGRHLLDMGRFAGAVIALDHHPAVVFEAGQDGERHIPVEQIIRIDIGHVLVGP